MTQHSTHTSIQAHVEANSLSTDTRKKEGFSKLVYLHRALHGQDHHLGGKSLINVEVYVKPVGRGGVVI